MTDTATKKRRMPGDVLQDRSAGAATGDILEGIVGGSGPAPDGDAEAAARRWFEDRRLDHAEREVKTWARRAFLVGLLPWPLVAGLVLAVYQYLQVEMLAGRYRGTARFGALRAAVYSLGGAIFALWLAGGLVAALPLLGALSWLLWFGLTAMLSSYLVGRIFIKHYEAGGTLLQLDPRPLHDYFRDKYGRPG